LRRGHIEKKLSDRTGLDASKYWNGQRGGHATSAAIAGGSLDLDGCAVFITANYTAPAFQL